MIEKRYLDFHDICAVYGIGERNARKIIREIRNLYEDGHPLPQGKVFVTDLDLYEQKVRKTK